MTSGSNIVSLKTVTPPVTVGHADRAGVVTILPDIPVVTGVVVVAAAATVGAGVAVIRRVTAATQAVVGAAAAGRVVTAAWDMFGRRAPAAEEFRFTVATAVCP